MLTNNVPPKELGREEGLQRIQKGVQKVVTAPHGKQGHLSPGLYWKGRDGRGKGYNCF